MTTKPINRNEVTVVKDPIACALRKIKQDMAATRDIIKRELEKGRMTWTKRE